MNRTWANVLFLELVDDAPSDAIDQVDSDGRRIIDFGSDYGEHIGVKVLVEQLTILTESSRENGLWMACSRGCLVLGPHINYIMLISKGDFPNVLRFHGSHVDAVPVDLAIDTIN